MLKLLGGQTDQASVVFTMSEAYWISLRIARGWVAYSLAGTRSAITLEAELWPGTALLVDRDDTPGPLTVESTDATDGPSGVGAFRILVEYLDDDGFERFGVGELDGSISNPVVVNQFTRVIDADGNETIAPLVPTTPATGTRINRLSAIELGSAATGYTAGNVGTVSGSIDGREQAAMAPTDNISNCSCFASPKGRISILHALSLAGDVSADSRNKVYVKPRGGPRIDFATLNVGTQPLPTNLPLPVTIPKLGDVVFTAQRSGGSPLEASTTYQIVLIPDPDDLDTNEILQPPRLT